VTALLIVLTVVEVVLLVAALAYFLVRIRTSLKSTAGYLAKVSFGVRAIETQCSSIGPSVTRINGQLSAIAGALDGLARQAQDGRRG
jgi:hypothetical protein